MITILLSSLSVLLVLLPSSHALSVSAPSARPYCINLKCTVNPSRRDDFLVLVRENQRLTLDEELDALQYVVGEDTTTPNTFYIHEQFTSEQGFLAHKETDHNARWQEFRDTNPFLEDPVAHFYHGTHVAEKVPVRNAYCVNVQLCIDEAAREEFLDVIENNARGSNQEEPLCLQYVWGESCAEANTFYFHEEYIGKEGFDAHAATKHFQKWEVFAATEPFTKPPIVNFYKTLPTI